MNCANQIVHIIQAGDTLFSLANRYRTTVDKILRLNPGTEIYNLQIGASLLICPGFEEPELPVPPTPVPPVTPVPPIGTLPSLEVLRELLMQILQWIRERFGDSAVSRIMDDLLI